MIAKGSGYVRGNREAARTRLTSHLKYIEHRSRDLSHESRDDRRLFDNEQDVVPRRDAVHEVMQHTSTSVNFHKIVLSPGEDEPVADYREWTRQVMHDLEEAQGKELHWFASYHQNTDHPHVHVVVAGAGYNPETEREEPVKLYTKDYDLLRQSGQDHSDFSFYHFLEEQYQELEQQDSILDHDHDDLSSGHTALSPSLEEFER